LTSRARALVFPTLYEGFGLPILEAFHCDTPVLCSNVASCPEVAGDAALMVHPTSVPELADGIQRIWTDAGLRETLVAKGRVRREAFSWDETMEDVRASLRAVVKTPKTRIGAFRRLLRAFRPASLLA
jgi:glycosyltransferase involved in cell wall biosynthesis